MLALGLLVGGQGWGMGLGAFSGHTSLAAGVVYCALVAHAGAGARAQARPSPR